MASNRHLGRIIVLQSLYEYEFRTKAGDATVDIDTIVAKDIEPYAKALGDTAFVYALAHSVADRFNELDAVLQPMAPEWPLDTIAAVDRNILRMGLYELQSSADTVPPKVAINEAVELAKAFGSENSSRFINGVLGTAYRQIYGDKTPADARKESAEGTTESAETAGDAEVAGAANATEAGVAAAAATPEPSIPKEQNAKEEVGSEA